MSNFKKVVMSLGVSIFSLILVGCGSSSSSGNSGENAGSTAATVKFTTINFEQNASYTFTDFDGGTADVIDNPQSNSTNSSSKVAQMIKDGGQAWGGSALSLTEAVNFSSGTAFKMNVYSPRAVRVLFKLEGSIDADNANGADNASEAEVSHTGGGWKELTFNLQNVDVFASDPAKKITFIFDNGVVGAHSSTPADWAFYFDDITQTTAAAQTASSVPTDAPTAPSLPSTHVTSIYSEAYTDLASNANPGWSEVASEETYAGNKVRKSSNFQPFQLNAEANVSVHSTLNIDVWSENGEQNILIKLITISGDADRGEYTIDQTNVTGGQWNHFEIPLSAFTTYGNYSLTQLTQVLFDQTPDAVVYYDNMYFHGTGTSQTPVVIVADATPTDAPTAPTLAESDVISIYSDAYTDLASNANPGWSEVASEETYAGTKVRKSSNFQPFDLNAEADVSGLSVFTFDIWDEKGEQDILIKIPTPNGSNEAHYTVDKGQITAGQWNTIEVDLSSFTAGSGTIDWTKVKQVLLDLQGNTVAYFDNIYFK